MSLQIWLPLNGNTINQGISGFLPAATDMTYTNSGKISANCYASGEITMPASETAKIFNNKAISIAFWIKPLNTNNSIIFGNDANRQFSLFQYSGSDATKHGTALHWSWQMTLSGGDSWLDDVLPINTWTHVCVTYNNPNFKVYINGELKAKRSGESNVSSFAYDTSIINNSTSRHLADMRVYDHALSALEVKELSKGLAIHYTFDDELACGVVNYDPCKNATAEKALTGLNGHGVTSTFGKYFGYDSFEIKIHSEPKNDGGWRGAYLYCEPVACGVPRTVATRSYWMYVPSSQKDKILDICRPVVEGSAQNLGIIQYDLNHCDTWQRVSATALIKGNDAKLLAYFMSVSEGSSDIIDFTCYVRDFQLELSGSPSPHTPSSRPSLLQNEAGFTQPSGVVDLSLSTNSRVGKYSGHFNGMTSCIDTSMIKSDMFTSDYTLNFWAYPLNNGRSIYFGDYNTTDGGFVNIERFADGNFRYWYNGGENDKDKIVFGLNAEVNKWTMLTVSHSAGVLKFYKNGDYIESYTLLEPIAKTSGIMRIGRDGRGATDATVPDNTPFYGYMDDFRFYVTQLSDEEILDLYNCGASLSDLGDAHANNFIENATYHGVDEYHNIQANEIYEDVLGKDYQQLEYLEATGTQYINTGFIPNNNTHIQIIYKSKTNELKALFGARAASNRSVFTAWVQEGNIYTHYGDRDYNAISPISGDTSQKFIYNQNKNIGTVLFNNNTEGSAISNEALFNSGCNLTLLAINSNGTIDERRSIGYLYSCQLYDNGTLIRDYYPARRISDGVLGLYDVVNNEFYTNAGSDSFKAGPTVTVNETSAFTENKNFTSRQIIEI